MKLIVGLGNPGKEYINTRHNMGFQLLDYIASKNQYCFSKEKFNASCAEVVINGEKVLLIKPLSYMNLSGTVVAKYVSFYKINLDDILIIQDDLDMNFGRVKIVYNSSCGGHNGIRDIERCLGTKKYTRLKIGIAHDKSMDTKDYVLGSFSKDEQKEMMRIDQYLENVISDFCCMNLEHLMSKYNRR